jgi:carboxyl-terminal processing protease
MNRPTMNRSTLLALAFVLAATPALALAQQQAPVSPAQDKPQPQAQPQADDEGSEDSDQALPPADDPDASEAAATQVPLAEIKRFVGVFNAVREAYVDPVSDEQLMHAAIKGLLLDLDPHSTYFDKEDAEAFDEETSGAYEGIGVEVQPQPDGSIQVIAPIDDTPAARAGVKAGDLIVAVDGKPLQPGDDGMGPLRGKPGTKVVLTIERAGLDKPIDIPVMRDTIRVASVRGRMLEPGYGYIRVAAFQADTAADFERVLGNLQTQSGGLRGLVLDLRSNPGGLLVSAVQIADDLLDKGTIVSTRGRIPISDAQFSATPGDRLQGAPLVVLVDAGSASAAEVLAGALDDNNRARIVGSRTFGKGSVQTLLPLDNGDSVKLTTARYYTPSGKSIQGVGIVPDVVLKPDKATAEKEAEDGYAPYTEASLPGHLRGEDEAAAGDNAGDVLPGDAPIAAALQELKQPVAQAETKPKG